MIIRKEVEEEKKQYERTQSQDSTWYHEGPDTLRIARQWIAEYSLPRTKLRLEEARNLRDLPPASKTAKTQELQKRLQAMSIHSSQIGDTRPVSYCSFSPNSQMLATASWWVIWIICTYNSHLAHQISRLIIQVQWHIRSTLNAARKKIIFRKGPIRFWQNL